MKTIARALLLAACASGTAAVEIPIDRDNIDIEISTSIKPGTYEVADADSSGVLHISASDVTLDFQGATLRGSRNDAAPDTRKGIGLCIERAKNVTVRNATLHGFAVALRAVKCENLVIEKCDFSSSLAQRLKSREKEEHIGEDFLELRDVEAWRGYGAGLWLEGCANCTIRNCTASDAQNGLLLVDSSRCVVSLNDFSFNSGWGIGLSGACDNVLIYNLLDFCLRGTWWPNYRGGGDSAAFAIVNGSDRNWIVANSMTHGGDGFFLSNHADAGNPRDGDCNDNVIAFNDGSAASANAFESTFSLRNVFVGNLGTHGSYSFWGGFSSHNVLVGNAFSDNDADGIAIEHGEGNVIEGNSIVRCGQSGVHLWSIQDNSAPRVQNPSKDVLIAHNLVARNGRAGIALQGTDGARLEGNMIADNLFGLDVTDHMSGVVAHGNAFLNRKLEGNLAAGKKAKFVIKGKEHAGAHTTNGITFGDPDFEAHWEPGDFYEIDLGKTESFNRILLSTRSVDPFHFLFDFTVLASESGKFAGEEKELLRVKSKENRRVREIVLPAAKGRYVRIVSRTAQDWVGIVEFELFDVTDEEAFRDRPGGGVWLARSATPIDAKGNFWSDESGRKLADLVKGVDPAEPLEKAPARAETSRLLTWAGLDALRDGKGDDFKRELEGVLRRVGCKIDLRTALPAERSFKMYRETGRPFGLKWLCVGEWGPLRPEGN